MSRPKITKITVEIDGKAPIEIRDPGNVSALFFTDEAVKQMLVPYYTAIGKAADGTAAATDWDAVDPTTTLQAGGVIKRPNCTYEILN